MGVSPFEQESNYKANGGFSIPEGYGASAATINSDFSFGAGAGAGLNSDFKPFADATPAAPTIGGGYGDGGAFANAAANIDLNALPDLQLDLGGDFSNLTTDLPNITTPLTNPGSIQNLDGLPEVATNLGGNLGDAVALPANDFQNLSLPGDFTFDPSTMTNTDVGDGYNDNTQTNPIEIPLNFPDFSNMEEFGDVEDNVVKAEEDAAEEFVPPEETDATTGELQEQFSDTKDRDELQEQLDNLSKNDDNNGLDLPPGLGDSDGNISEEAQNKIDEAQEQFEEESGQDRVNADDGIEKVEEQLEQQITEEIKEQQEKEKNGEKSEDCDSCDKTKSPGGLDPSVVEAVSEKATEEVEEKTTAEDTKSTTPGDGITEAKDDGDENVSSPQLYSDRTVIEEAVSIGDTGINLSISYENTYDKSKTSDAYNTANDLFNFSSDGYHDFINDRDSKLNPDGSADVMFNASFSSTDVHHHTRESVYGMGDFANVDSQSGPSYQLKSSETTTDTYDYSKLEIEFGARYLAGNEGEKYGLDYNDRLGFGGKYSEDKFSDGFDASAFPELDAAGFKEHKEFELGWSYAPEDGDIFGTDTLKAIGAAPLITAEKLLVNPIVDGFERDGLRGVGENLIGNTYDFAKGVLPGVVGGLLGGGMSF